MSTSEYLSHPHVVKLNEFHSDFCCSIELLEHIRDSHEDEGWVLILISKIIKDFEKMRDSFPFPENNEIVFVDK